VLGSGDDFLGAGACAEKTRECIPSTFTIEGGDTLNGKGDMNDVVDVAAWCASAAPSSAINIVGGLPGPAKTRRHGTFVINVPSIP